MVWSPFSPIHSKALDVGEAGFGRRAFIVLKNERDRLSAGREVRFRVDGNWVVCGFLMMKESGALG
ncbi:MAG: hypothetical protein ACUVV5_11165 [Candidatus Aminicenantales bacterium]